MVVAVAEWAQNMLLCFGMCHGGVFQCVPKYDSFDICQCYFVLFPTAVFIIALLFFLYIDSFIFYCFVVFDY